MDKYKNVKDGYDLELVLLRFLGMLMIVGCHLTTYFQLSVLGQILNVGVQLFLFISGWIYSNRTIEDGKKWLGKRWLRICVPMYMWVVVLYILELGINGNRGVLSGIPVYLMDLQGISFLIEGVNPHLIIGTGHMWFLTAIMLCYMFTIVMKKIDVSVNKKSFAIFVFLGIVGVTVFAYVGVYMEWIFVYFLGYFLARLWRDYTDKQWLLLTGCMLAAMAIRLGMRCFADGTILYDVIVSQLTHNVLAIWIFGTVKWLGTKTGFIRELANNRIIGYFEGLSYYIYIVHYYFLTGTFSVRKMADNIGLQMLIFVILVWISAVILQKMDYFLIKNIEKILLKKRG